TLTTAQSLPSAAPLGLSDDGNPDRVVKLVEQVAVWFGGLPVTVMAPPRQSFTTRLLTVVFPSLQTFTPSVTCTWRSLFPSRHVSHCLNTVMPVVTFGPQLLGSPQSAVPGPTFCGVPLESAEAVTEMLFRAPDPKITLESSVPV